MLILRILLMKSGAAHRFYQDNSEHDTNLPAIITPKKMEPIIVPNATQLPRLMTSTKEALYRQSGTGGGQMERWR